MCERVRQRKRWKDNIKELTGLEWNILQRKVEDREEWRKLVVKFTVVPQWSARLRDRYDKIRRCEVLPSTSKLPSLEGPPPPPPLLPITQHSTAQPKPNQTKPKRSEQTKPNQTTKPPKQANKEEEQQQQLYLH